MTKFSEMADALVEAEAFDAKAFEGSAEWPQELCDLMLVLALAFNDFKDAITAHVVLNAARPSGERAKTAPWGNHGGIAVHIMRVQSGLVYELLEFLRNNSKILNSPKFKSIVRRLALPQREAWKGLEDAALQRGPARAFTEALKGIRNKVAFHYDPTALGEAYREFFSEPDEKPMISLGDNLPSSRFYFADAAAWRAIANPSVEEKAKRFLSGEDEILRQIHQALFHLVSYFIQLRGIRLPSLTKRARKPRSI
jgi:hypothetical protein